MASFRVQRRVGSLIRAEDNFHGVLGDRMLIGRLEKVSAGGGDCVA